ncbi:MAG TPA: polysaccharide biosynthesis tyrosine autokinase [Gaiellaceae bacterium]|nr:polysaccharide biosynthesis tyrosine autokinase [Gaiellaceae bacterium]
MPTTVSPDLRSYLAVLWRRKWIILPFVVLVPLIAYVVQSGKPAVYQASSDVLLSRTSLSGSIAGLDDPNIWNPERYSRNQVELARSPAVAERVLTAERLDWSPYTLLGISSVTAVEAADLLRFVVTNGDPDLAARLATGYAAGYIDYRLEVDTRAMQRALTAIRRQLRELRETRSAGTDTYTGLVEKQQQLETAVALQTANALLVRPAVGAGQIAPNPKRSAIVGLLVGIILGLGLAFLRDALDVGARSADEIGDLLELPLLGKLPPPPLTQRRAVTMLVSPDRVEAEPYRILRSNLEFVMLDRPAKTVMLTSATTGEGKSTVASNLAVALALAGRRTVLVDLDLRRPSISRLFGLDQRPGITDAALGRVPLAAAIRRVTLPTTQTAPGSVGNGGFESPVLHVVPTGSIPPNLGEFALSDALARILDELEERSDILIVDSSPALMTSDALTLSRRFDAVLLVAKLGTFRRTMVRDMRRFLETSPATKLGVVITGAASAAGYGYYTDQRPNFEAPLVSGRSPQRRGVARRRRR